MRVWFSVSFLFLLLLSACGPGRSAIKPGEIPYGEYVTAEDEAYGLQVLSVLNKSYPIDRDDRNVWRVRDLVERLASAAHAGQSPWNVYVLKGDNVVNAAATRGNFVFVWTGMLNTAYTDGELATVLAHELGHVLAEHTRPTPYEEASSIVSTVSGDVVGSAVASQPGYAGLGRIAGGLVTEMLKAFVVNPESHRQELEADQIGLFLMADAGFDPYEALALWSRLEQEHSSSGGSLQFFSSHPATEARLEELEKLLPAAMLRYQSAQTYGHRSYAPAQVQIPDSFAIEEGR